MLDHIKDLYTVEEIFAKYESNEFGPEHLLQHALVHLKSLATPSHAEPAKGATLADRLEEMADAQLEGSQAQADLYAAATIWRKHLRPNHPENEGSAPDAPNRPQVESGSRSDCFDSKPFAYYVYVRAGATRRVRSRP